MAVPDSHREVERLVAGGDLMLVAQHALSGHLRNPILSWAAEYIGVMTKTTEDALVCCSVAKHVGRHPCSYVKEGALLGVVAALERAQDGEAVIDNDVRHRLLAIVRWFTTQEHSTTLQAIAREALADL